MLNKQVCLKCHELRVIKVANRGFDSLWQSGLVACIWKFWAHTNEDPPERCEYILEHMVNKK